MAALILETHAEPLRIDLDRPALSLGSSEACDVILQGRGVRAQHAVIFREGSSYRVAASAGAPLTLNGRKVAAAKLAAGDRLTLGSVALTLTGEAIPEACVERPAAAGALQALSAFAATLGGGLAYRDLLERLLIAAVTELGADGGLLAAPSLREGEAQIFLSHPVGPAGAGSLRSDSLIAGVLRSGEPRLHPPLPGAPPLSDAPSLAGANLASAAAVPLLLPGETLGAIYVGRRPGRPPFGREDLTALSAFAAVASLLLGNARELTELAEKVRGLTERLRALEGETLIGDSPAVREVVRTAELAAPSGLSVLLLGETGTGKELLARLIHRRSSRMGPFVAQSCAAIPSELAEAVLFGSVRGAFTDAEDREGLFETARGGTLLLDEVGELPPALQPKLLRVLQERTVTRVGDTRERAVDVRVVAATHRDLASGESFRRDLYFRLAQIVLRVPPLRDRGDDVLLLAHHFLRQERQGLAFTARAQQCLLAHRWPGNVRELQAKVRSAAVLSARKVIGASELGFVAPEAIEPLEAARDRFLRRHVEEAVALAGGNKRRAAELLGISVRSLFRHLGGEEAT
ncbi:MAG: sigma 54-interacting transcriptional regulator [Myxococcales bacterium]